MDHAPPNEAFGKRFTIACDGSSDVPEPNYGRLGWIASELEAKHSIEVTQESVRRWLSGISVPRAKTLAALAELLSVDDAWLALGSDPDLTNRQRRLRNASADGAVNVVAGFIQMNGGHPAFPDDADANNPVDLTAIIKGAQYSIHVTLAVQSKDEWKVSFPVSAEKCLVIAVVPLSDVGCRFFDLDWDTIGEIGIRSGGKYTVALDPDAGDFYEIKTFSKRL